MEDDQQFCLRWNNHQSTLISVFDNLLASETLVDCTLAAEGKHLKAHKVVLSACSPYFASLLKEQYDKHPIFILKDVKYQELRYMMDYMYRGEVNISQDQLAALLKAAESLQIKGLSDNRPSVPKPEQQQHQQHQHPHHRATLPTNVGSVSGVVPKYPGSNYTLEQTKRTRLSGRTMGSIDTSEMDSREGSSSPSRKHRKLRRKSQDNAMNDTLDNSNSSQLLQSNQQQHLQQQQQQQQVVNANVVAGLSGVGAITAAASALAAGSAAGAVLHTGPSLAAAAAAAAAAAVASVGPTSSSAGGGGSSVKKTDSLKATSQADTMNIIDSQTAGGSNMSIVASSSVTDAVSDHHHQHQTLHHHQYQAHHTDTTTGTDNKMNHKQKLQQQQQPSSKDIISTNQSELVIEPKSEYDDEANDEAVEDLTLDEEDMGMDDLDQKAGPSQGGEGSSQGYAPWQQDQSQDDLLLNAQEAQQRDPQVMRPKKFARRHFANKRRSLKKRAQYSSGKVVVPQSITGTTTTITPTTTNKTTKTTTPTSIRTRSSNSTTTAVAAVAAAAVAVATTATTKTTTTTIITNTAAAIGTATAPVRAPASVNAQRYTANVRKTRKRRGRSGRRVGKGKGAERGAITTSEDLMIELIKDENCEHQERTLESLGPITINIAGITTATLTTTTTATTAKSIVTPITTPIISSDYDCDKVSFTSLLAKTERFDLICNQSASTTSTTTTTNPTINNMKMMPTTSRVTASALTVAGRSKKAKRNESYFCTNCGRTYQTLSTLRRHMRSECNQPKKFVCNICQRGFHHNFKLSDHYRRLHDA